MHSCLRCLHSLIFICIGVWCPLKLVYRLSRSWIWFSSNAYMTYSIINKRTDGCEKDICSTSSRCLELGKKRLSLRLSYAFHCKRLIFKFYFQKLYTRCASKTLSNLFRLSWITDVRRACHVTSYFRPGWETPRCSRTFSSLDDYEAAPSHCALKDSCYLSSGCTRLLEDQMHLRIPLPVVSVVERQGRERPVLSFISGAFPLRLRPQFQAPNINLSATQQQQQQ